MGRSDFYNYLIDSSKPPISFDSKEFHGEIGNIKEVFFHHVVIGVNTNPKCPSLNGVYTRDQYGDVRQFSFTPKELRDFFDPYVEESPKRTPFVPFTSPIIMHGECEPEVRRAHSQMDEVLEDNCGRQQGHMSTDSESTEDSVDYERKLREEMDERIRSIVIAMDGEHLLKPRA